MPPKLPLQKLQELLDKLSVYRTGVVIIGGPEDASEAEALCTNRQQVFSMCGISSLQESALLIKHAVVVITHDTGMMHIAAALKKQVISVWGIPSPEFGMYPYFGNHKHCTNKEKLACSSKTYLPFLSPLLQDRF